MQEYIYQVRGGVHIIDLSKVSDYLDRAYEFVKAQAAEGKTFLFVGTKKQAQESVKEVASANGIFYINERWLGGTLTNFATIRSRVDRLKRLEKMEEDGTFEILPKKEVLGLKLEKEKLEKNLGGIKEMTKIPDIIFLIDPMKEKIAVREARKMGVTLVGIVDTNCDPDDVDVIIPGNDDANRAVTLFVETIARAVVEGREGESYMPASEQEAEELSEVAEVKEIVKEESAEAQTEVKEG
jgi:small subunit ribosomal protein S2